MPKKSWHQYSQNNKSSIAGRTDRWGTVHDSKTEMQRWEYLNMLAKAGVITDLKRQVRYNLIANADCEVSPVRIIKNGKQCYYTPDFVYTDEDGERIIEDVKGYKDELSAFRIAVFESLTCYKVHIIEKKSGQWIRTDHHAKN